MKTIAFLPQAFDDFTRWVIEGRKTYRKIIDLIRDIQKQPFAGIGKPEPLKHELRGLWSRCITLEHRLVYKITDNEIIIVSCKFHH